MNSENKEERLQALKELIFLEESGALAKPEIGSYVNNHIHTIYSFSPYSPTSALYFARKAGLVTAGIMDHDSVGGCEEFVRAGEIARMSTTCGFECRVDMSSTPLYGRRINNPDQISVAYVAIHGIPHQNLKKCEEFLSPYRAQRNVRNRKMVEKIDSIVSPYGVHLDFEKDVVPLSQNDDLGSITERHILCGLANNITKTFGRGKPATEFIKNKLALPISEKVEGFLLDDNNPHYIYDLIGALKSDFVASFYIDADKECPHVTDFIQFSNEIGGISAYAYLGDVLNSATGDKKTQRFEDEYLDELFKVISDLGFKAVTYMPSRNTLEQLNRVMALCENYGLFQISGEDINTSRQSFICPALAKSEFAHLSMATWVLIGHEKAATKNIEDGLFSQKTIKQYPKLVNRLPIFENIGKQ